MSDGQCDIAIIGGGPAGLSAAIQASKQGADVLLLDEQASVGGQIYRSIEHQSDKHTQLLGPDYQYGKQLVLGFRQSNVKYIPESRVWSINSKREIAFTHPDGTQVILAKKIIIASGAMERPMPFTGWTLPGVMNAGAGQVLFKAHKILPSEDVVLAGSGPLLLLLAWQYLRAGLKVQALLDLTPMSNHFSAVKYLPRAFLAHKYLRKGLGYEWALKRAGVNIVRNVSELRAIGDGKLQSAEYSVKGQKQQLSTEHLLVHFGVIPVNQLSQVAGCQHHWDDSQQCWRPNTDEWGQSSLTGIYITGDGASIAGGKSAEYAGHLAALHSLGELGILNQDKRDNMAQPYQRMLNADQRIRPFLEAYFRLPKAILEINDQQTIVCRCEEVTAGQIRQAVEDGHTDNNQVKFLTRCGMGPCQGRQCSPSVGHIVASITGENIQQSGYYRVRPPVNTLSLQELACLYPQEQE
jgi:NADPH-dependent 2,4-dienoyl-CoA reductase/sulfur reductase-like enzyme